MGLKYKIAALTEVSEAVRTLYKQEGDSYVLDVEGAVDRTRLDEFRNNNVLLQQQLEKLKGIDPVKYNELVDLDRQVKEKELIKAGDIEGVVNGRVAAMREEWTGRATTAETALAQAHQQLAVLMIDNSVRAEAIKLGVLPTAIDDVILRARALYQMENGVPVPKAEGKILYGKDGTTPMPIGDWAVGLKKTAPHLFQGSSGSGAGGGDRPNGAIDVSKLTPAQKITYGLTQGGPLLKALPGV